MSRQMVWVLWMLVGVTRGVWAQERDFTGRLIHRTTEEWKQFHQGRSLVDEVEFLLQAHGTRAEDFPHALEVHGRGVIDLLVQYAKGERKLTRAGWGADDRVYEAESARIQANAIVLLGGAKAPELLSIAHASLEGRLKLANEKDYLSSIFDALANHGGKAEVAYLVSLLDTAIPEREPRYFRALGRVAGAESLPQLERYLRSTDRGVRQLAELGVENIKRRYGLVAPATGFQPLKTLPAGATALLEPATGTPR